MSLLIKALEQAAKDRKGTRVEPPSDNAAPGAEPTLEAAPAPRVRAATRLDEAPSAPQQVPPTARSSAAPTPAATAPAPRAPSPAIERPVTPPRAPSSLADVSKSDAQQQRARAAAVMQAASGSAANLIALLRANPVMMFGALAVLFGLGFGVYVYIEIAHPGAFARSAVTKSPEPPAPSAEAPASAPAPAAPSAPVAVAPVPAPAASPAAAPIANASPNATPSPAAASVAASEAPRAPASASGPVPAAAVIGSAPTAENPPSPPAERAASESRRERGRVKSEGSPPAAAAPAAAAAVDNAAGARERIAVSPTNAQPRLNPLLTQAYTLLQGGDVEDAHALYTKVTQAEPLNIDGLLGLAYIAARQNRTDEATQLYVRILQLNPRHALAQAGLIGMMGRADPTASESRLKQLIAREPSAFLHFVLGNVYADQSHWSQAQQSYFQAHHLEPGNPDYAYNLAVGLDHLRQTKLALKFYRMAVDLASAQGRPNFSLEHVRERIRVLTSQAE